jgi:hypothetical protein
MITMSTIDSTLNEAQRKALDELGGEALAGSGFETEPVVNEFLGEANHG